MSTQKIQASSPARRRDPYEVLGVGKDANQQQIKAAYKKLALKFHPDKNADNPDSAEMFKEIAYSYEVLSDPAKRHQYDISGFEAADVDGLEVELDLSNLGTVNTMFVAIFSKLGVPIKTSISPYLLEEAMNGTVTVRPLPLGKLVNDRVEKQLAHFYEVTISEEEANAGIVVRVTSQAQSKFKLLYFTKEDTGGFSLALQEDSAKTGKFTSAGMYFLHFKVYRLDRTLNAFAMAKDPEAALFKKLEGLQPCEVSELKAGTHIFAVYGDNFFKNATYSISAFSAEPFKDSAEKLRGMEAQLLNKQNELRQFEKEYKEVVARFIDISKKLEDEKILVNDLLKLRRSIQASFSAAQMKGHIERKVNDLPKSKKSFNASFSTQVKGDSGGGIPVEGKASTPEKSPSKDNKSNKKKWFSISSKVEKTV